MSNGNYRDQPGPPQNMNQPPWSTTELGSRQGLIPAQPYHYRMADTRESTLSWTRGSNEGQRPAYEDPYFIPKHVASNLASSSSVPVPYYQPGSINYSAFPSSYEAKPSMPPPARHPSEMSESVSPGVGGDEEGRRISQGQTKLTKTGKRARVAPDVDQRLKTGRACDTCRSKKLRCEIIPDLEPPMCAYCKRRNRECTFVLPISETRPPKKPKKDATISVPLEDVPTGEDLKLSMVEGVSGGNTTNQRSARIQGETSVMFLLHSAIAVPEDAFNWYDSRHNTTWEVTDSGDGVIKVHHPDAIKPGLKEQIVGSKASPNDFSSPTVLDRASPPPTPVAATTEIPAVEKPVETATLSLSTLQNLVNIYFESVAPLFPFVTRREFLANSSPPPQLLYAICGVAAARRDIPESTFAALRKMINAVMIKWMVAVEPSRVNIQTLLVLSLVGELNWSAADTIGTTALMRLAAAIRMAQHLGLHRSNDFPEINKTTDGERDLQAMANLESDRRIWAGCVIMDRWYATLHGVPCLINLGDCDSDLPSPRDVYPSSDSFPPYLFMRELVKLSNLLDRILKTLYTPSGLTNVTDEQLHTLRSEISSWQDGLPIELRLSGIDSRPEAGLLRLMSVTVGFLFFRLFMRMAYACPPHLTFQVEMEPWQQFLASSNEAIAWLNNNDSILDILSVTSYAATACALIFYNTWIRRRDQDSINSLEKIKNCVRRWEEAVPSGHMVVRRKMTEVISLLDATARQPVLAEPRRRRLNPARGAINSAPTNLGVTFVPDRSRPSGGFYVVGDKYKGRLEDLPKGNYMRTDGSMAAESNARSTLEENADYMPVSRQTATQLASGSAFSPDLTLPAMEGDLLDPGLAGTFETGLDGLPTLVQDWNQWDEFFSRLGDMPPPPPGELV